MSKLELLDIINSECERSWKTEEKHNKPEVYKEMSTLDGLAMMLNVDISLNQYQKLRNYLLPFGFSLPTRNAISDYKKTLLPGELIVEDTKTSCDMQALALQTVSGIIEVETSKDVPTPLPDAHQLLMHNPTVKVNAKFGVDGSGSHQIRHQQENNNESSIQSSKNYLGAFWCPLQVDVDSKTIWKNPLPNSIVYSRPLFLVREKEDRASLKKHFRPYIVESKKLEDVHESVLSIKGHQSNVILQVSSELSMIDGKVVDAIQGDSGAWCHYCYTTKQDGNTISVILQGFPLEKTVEEMTATWEAVETGEMAYQDPNRAGQCHEPLNSKDLRFFAILHQQLRSLDHCQKLLYHLASGQTHTWSETGRTKEILKKEKARIIEYLSKKYSFLMDTPTSNGGNTNTGGLAKRFFDPKNREVIGSCINNQEDRENFITLLGYFNKILSITQCSDISKVVDTEKLKYLGMDLMLHHKRSFPFAVISQSVHQMCAHSHQLFEITGGKPIGIYAEQSVESWNKHIRAYKSGPACKARQMSIKLNTLDIFERMSIRSHPYVADKRRQLYCSYCEKDADHTTISCPKKVHGPLTEKQSEIRAMFI